MRYINSHYITLLHTNNNCMPVSERHAIIILQLCDKLNRKHHDVARTLSSLIHI